ncbi:MAG: bifunctional diguanylate cyclase/phosphodiesterase [Spirochaetales bacterium]|nr:bifunctional diguanylate cyclase/phosphodiesterase [Spirochaetales bacterium]
MIKKYKDQPMWLQMLVASGILILIINIIGLFFQLRILKISSSALPGWITIQALIMLSTAGIFAAVSIIKTKSLSDYLRKRFRTVTLLEPAFKNETRLVTGVLDEYSRIFNEKNKDLSEQTKKAESLFNLTDEMPLPVIRLDADGIYSYMNNAAWGASLDKLFDRNGRLLAPWQNNIKDIITKKSSVEWTTGSSKYLVQPINIKGMRESYICLNDIADGKELLDKLNNYDLLTNLPNRVLFMEVLNRTVKYAERTGESCVCILIDIDDLERINDTIGYHEGDKLLRQFGARLLETLREEDTAARLSGDEFVVLIPRLSRANLSLDFLQRIQNSLTEPFTLLGEETKIAISMGISIYPEDGASSEELLKKAKIALARTKKLRRGTFTIFDPQYDSQTIKRRAMEQSLQNATVNGEFELYYQPKVNTDTEMISGFEALIRWNREDPISPAEFIPLAEETGAIVDIGKFVIDEAARFLNRLSDRGRGDLQVAINISARQFKEPGFENYLIKAAKSHNLDFSRLELEVTEGVAATETSGALNGIASLSSQGFPIAIDDFGTGYSSMNYLQDLRFDTLKIDKSFIDNINSESGLPIVKAIIALGKSIQKKIVAEGVETKEQLDVLRVEGCDMIQGYYYSRPVPGDEAIRLIESWPVQRKKSI